MRSTLLAVLFVSACSQPQPVPPPMEPAPAPAPPEAARESAPPPAPPKIELPPAPPLPPEPAFLGPVPENSDNPTTPEKAQLGYLLFFDKRMSKGGSMACVNCHLPDKGWIVPEALSAKVGGAINKRNAPTVLNLGYHASFYWDGRMPTLEKVSNAAWKGQLGADPAAVAGKLNESRIYQAHFQRAFGEDATAENVPRALAAFFRTLRSGDSAWDKHEQDGASISKEAARGFEVFRQAECALCHVPPLYSDSQFHNMGIGWDKPDHDKGRMDATSDPADEGKFKTPSLRDVALTGPYFHDGSVATLDEAIEIMIAGGKKNPRLDEKLKPRKLKGDDKAALKAFLESLGGQPTYRTAPELPAE